jgi:hypothetical protein
MQQLNKEPTLTEEMASEEREEIRQDFQEKDRAGDREANCQIFRLDSKNEELDTVEESAPSETEKEITR